MIRKPGRGQRGATSGDSSSECLPQPAVYGPWSFRLLVCRRVRIMGE